MKNVSNAKLVSEKVREDIFNSAQKETVDIAADIVALNKASRDGDAHAAEMLANIKELIITANQTIEVDAYDMIHATNSSLEVAINLMTIPRVKLKRMAAEEYGLEVSTRLISLTALDSFFKAAHNNAPEGGKPVSIFMRDDYRLWFERINYLTNAYIVKTLGNDVKQYRETAHKTKEFTGIKMEEVSKTGIRKAIEAVINCTGLAAYDDKKLISADASFVISAASRFSNASGKLILTRVSTMEKILLVVLNKVLTDGNYSVDYLKTNAK